MNTERFIPEGAKLVHEANGAAVYHFQNQLLHPCSLAFAGKSKKSAYNYRFKTPEARDEFDAKFLASQAAREKAKAERREELNKPHTLKVGDILVSSWGYEQTNVDFYQVIELIGKRDVLVQEIGCKTVGEPTGWASDRVIADPENKRGAPFKKRSNASNSISISSCQSARPWDGKDQHRSWYA